MPTIAAAGVSGSSHAKVSPARHAEECGDGYQPADVSADWVGYVTACQDEYFTTVFVTNETESLVIRALPSGYAEHNLWPDWDPTAALVRQVVSGTCTNSEYCIPPGRTMWFRNSDGLPFIALSRAPYASLAARAAVIESDFWLDRFLNLPKNVGHLVKCAKAVGSIQISENNPYVDGFTYGLASAIACDKVRVDLGYKAKQKQKFVSRAVVFADEVDSWSLVRDFFHVKLWRIPRL